MSNSLNTNNIERNNNKKISSNNNGLAVFGLLFGAMCWGIIWFPYRLMSEAGVSGIASSFYTYSIAILIAGIYFAKHWRGIFTVPKSIVCLCIVAGWTNIAYVLAVIDGEVMRVMLLFYLSPLWTLILAHYWLKERTNTRGVMVIAISLLGAFIMLYDFTGSHGSAQQNSWLNYLPIPKSSADWLALSAGIGFSLTNVITRKATYLTVRAKSFAVWFGVLAMALIFMVFVKVAVMYGFAVDSLAINSFPEPSFFNLTHWITMLVIALLIIAATVFVQYGVTQITATRASVLFLFELVVAAVASYYLAHEVMTWNEWLGGSFIVAAAVFSASNHNH